MGFLFISGVVFSSPPPCTRVLDGRLELGLLRFLVGLYNWLHLSWNLLGGSGRELGRSRPGGAARAAQGLKGAGILGQGMKPGGVDESGLLGSVTRRDLDMLCVQLNGLMLSSCWRDLLLGVLLGRRFLDLDGGVGGGQLLRCEGTRH